MTSTLVPSIDILLRRPGAELQRVSRTFEETSRARSWYYFYQTFALLLLAVVGSGVLAHVFWPAAIVTGTLAGCLIIRGFILYHDFLHGAILRNSAFARAVFTAYGLLVLVPSEAWRRNHNHHHGHVGKPSEFPIGEFPLMTTDEWREAGFKRRLRYRVLRHPVTIALAYVTVFGGHLCLRTFLSNPRRYVSSGLALALHALLIVAVLLAYGPVVLLLAVILPMTVATAGGALLFYIQHSFDGAHIHTEDEWTFHDAALDSSSFLDLGPVMHWLTGNIGYHHVHHLNHKIPFYNLPAAMRSVPELRDPPVVRPRLSDLSRAFRLALWDTEREAMVPIPKR